MLTPFIKKRILLSIITFDFILVLLLIRLGLELPIHTPLGNTIQVTQGFTYTPKTNIVYGYLPYWMLDNAKYIEYDKLTDIAYFGLHVGKDGNFIKIMSNSEGEPGLNAWRNDKNIDNIIKESKKHGVRFALTIVAQMDDDIDGFLNCPNCWDTLLENTITELEKRGIKDVNLDFEHVGQTTTDISDKYTAFVWFMNRNLDDHFKDSKVVVAAFADSYIRSRITNPTDLARVSDGIFVMAYDFHSTNSDRAGPVAPINGAPQRYEYDVATALKDYKSYVSPYKIILGVPYYGYNFLTEAAEPNAKRIPGSDDKGFTTPQNYAIIKGNDRIPLTRVQWNDISKNPYVIYTSAETGSIRVLHFENEKSLKVKYDLAKEENLLGVGIWALGYDGDNKELWELLGSEF